MRPEGWSSCAAATPKCRTARSGPHDRFRLVALYSRRVQSPEGSSFTVSYAGFANDTSGTDASNSATRLPSYICSVCLFPASFVLATLWGSKKASGSLVREDTMRRHIYAQLSAWCSLCAALLSTLSVAKPLPHKGYVDTSTVSAFERRCGSCTLCVQ
eukprot:scaffold5482_cov444-Prasinococcus_capsulatus_cf.AAC.2